MSTQQTPDQRIIDRYTDQPIRLPSVLRAQIEAIWGGQQIELYALYDLDDDFRLGERWIAVGKDYIAVAEHDDVVGDWLIDSFARSRVRGVLDAPMLSGNVLWILAGLGEAALAVLRYTNRQRRAMENVKFVLEQQLAGRSVKSSDADQHYASGVAGPVRDAQALVAGHRMAVLWRLLSYLKPYRAQVVVGMGAAAIITVVSLIPPYVAGFLIDRVVRPVQDGTLSVETGSTIAWVAVGAIAIVYVIRQLSALVRLRMMSVLGEYVARDLRTELYAHLQRLSLGFYSRKKTGSIITRVSADTDRLWEFLAFGVVDVSLSVIMLMGLSAVLISLDWRLGLVMAVPVPLFCYAIVLHGRRLEDLFVRAWRKWSRVTDVLSDTIPGMRVVKAFNQEGRETQRFKARNHDVTDEFNRIHRLWTTFWPSLMFAVHGTTVLVWVFALPRLLGDAVAAPSLSAGAFVSFLLYTTMFVPPIEIIGQMARIMNRATSSAHRVFEVLDTEPQIVNAPDAVQLDPVEGRVTFDNVTFGYDGVRQVIKGVSFDVMPGEMIGLVGPSGGGKTTIINLIARFYDPTGGVVRIDGVNIEAIDLDVFRRQVGIVLQDPYLFHGTVLDNVRYGTPSASLDDVIAAAKAANAHDFICKLSHGYDTIVGERGQSLSGGERQRVSIARAILHDPRILILDEATSAVDTETERHIQEAMDRLVAGRTVFAIAHRLSTLRKASRLFVVEDGKLAESGTHRELLRKPGGKYRTLYEMQQELA